MKLNKVIFSISMLSGACIMPLSYLSSCGCGPHNPEPEVVEPQFSQVGEGTMSDAKTAIISIDWTPSEDSIELSNYNFVCNGGATKATVQRISGVSSRPCEFQIIFNEDIDQNITDGILHFHYEDKTTKVSKDTSVSNIEITKFDPPGPVVTYDISITDADKNGYITSALESKAFFEYNLSTEGLVIGDVVSCTIVNAKYAPPNTKTKIDNQWVNHTIVEGEEHGIKLKVVPYSSDIDQPVFSDEFSVKFQFKHNGEVCFEKTIDKFVLDVALPTIPQYFTYEETDTDKILTGFDLDYEDYIKECGVLVVPNDVTKIADHAFDASVHRDYSNIFQNVKWLVLDKSFKGECALKEIGDYAFQNCNFFETLYIPSTIEKIGSYAFSGCRAFAHFEYLGGSTSPLSSVGSYAFASSTFGGTLYIPNAQSFTELKRCVFGLALSTDTSKNATKLVIPKNIQKFTTHCFEGFSNLKVIDLSDYDSVPTPTAFETYCFYKFPTEGTIYIKDESLRDTWVKVLSQQYVFEDFTKGTWTIEVKDTNK